MKARPPGRPSASRGSAGAGAPLAPLEQLGAALLVGLVVWRLADMALHRLRGSRAANLAVAGAGALLLAGGAAALLAVRRRRRRRPWDRRSHRPAAAASSWATPHDLAPLGVPAPQPGRLVIGRCGRRLLAAERGQSVIVIGPTQSHKTSGIAIPAILEWQGPVVATSVKTDLLRETIAWRRRTGRVLVYDPTATTGLATTGWSPLAASETWPGARRVAAALCSVARAGAHGGMDDAGFWYAMAEKLLAPLLFAAASAGASVADLCRWVDTQEAAEIELALELANEPAAVRAVLASFSREERQRSSIYATVESVLDAFADPAVLASAASADLVRPEELVGGGTDTLYVCAPAHEQERLQPVFVALLRQVLEAALERSSAQGRPLEPPLLVVLDEAANVAPIADLDRLASTAAGHGVQLVTVFQDMAQIEARYGARAGTVVNNHRGKVVLSGISDPATLDRMSRLVGEEEHRAASTTVDAEGRRSRTESPSTRALAPAAWLRRIAPGGGVLVYGHLPPARIELRPWFADRTLRSRATIPADKA